jgi:phosphopantetheinyl transferase (holo-ACP synthase)
VLKEWFEAKGLQAHITVTDESEYAASFCVVETAATATLPVSGNAAP